MSVEVLATALPGVIELRPRVFGDARGWFVEVWNPERLPAEVGPFVQDNLSHSVAGVLRGLHYQVAHVQGKLVRCVLGRIFDVAVDLREGSPTLGRWVGVWLDDATQNALWIPPGFAHGFLVADAPARVLYKVTDRYDPAAERTLAWDDPTVGVEWPLAGPPLLSPKDQVGLRLTDAPLVSL